MHQELQENRTSGASFTDEPEPAQCSTHFPSNTPQGLVRMRLGACGRFTAEKGANSRNWLDSIDTNAIVNSACWSICLRFLINFLHGLPTGFQHQCNCFIISKSEVREVAVATAPYPLNCAPFVFIWGFLGSRSDLVRISVSSELILNNRCEHTQDVLRMHLRSDHS